MSTSKDQSISLIDWMTGPGLRPELRDATPDELRRAMEDDGLELEQIEAVLAGSKATNERIKFEDEMYAEHGVYPITGPCPPVPPSRTFLPEPVGRQLDLVALQR